jgi:hypothetical protein
LTPRFPHFLDNRLSLTRQPPFTPRKIPGTHFCQRLSRPQGHTRSAAGRIRSIAKSNDLIKNRTRHLPACMMAFKGFYTGFKHVYRARHSSGDQPASHCCGLGSIPGHVGFVVDKVALGQASSEYFSFPCQFSFRKILHIHLSSGAGTTDPLVGRRTKWTQSHPTPREQSR